MLERYMITVIEASIFALQTGRIVAETWQGRQDEPPTDSAIVVQPSKSADNDDLLSIIRSSV